MDQIRNKTDFKSLITHRYTFKKIYDAFDIAVKNKAEALKVMLNFD
jgi:threonine dehydrogenase-like Zn-dependent dehydrogenase